MSEGREIVRITVVYALPDRQHAAALSLPAGATVADALAAVAGKPPFDALDLDRMPVGVFGDRVSPERVLEDRDRLELYRPLEIDPREARRRRALQPPERGGRG